MAEVPIYTTHAVHACSCVEDHTRSAAAAKMATYQGRAANLLTDTVPLATRVTRELSTGAVLSGNSCISSNNSMVIFK